MNGNVPNSKVLAEMKSRGNFYREYWDQFDCSEIADDLYNASSGNGKIIELKTDKLINVEEYGVVRSYEYHQVFSDGKYIYDPRYSSSPVLQTDYLNHINKLNNGNPVKLIDIKR